MRRSIRTPLLKLAVVALVSGLPMKTQAALFYGGDTQGLPGEQVELTINAEAGTVLEAIDIVPNIAGVSGVLDFVSLQEAPGLSDGGSGLCAAQACSYLYLPEKTFAANTVLATMRFNIDAAAAPGIVAFDPGIVVGETPQPMTAFEVMAVPEPSNWVLLLAGVSAVAFAYKRGQRQRRDRIASA